jgi:hypothetical protein
MSKIPLEPPASSNVTALARMANLDHVPAFMLRFRPENGIRPTNLLRFFAISFCEE